MRLAIDRFEGDYAVCERDDRTMMNVSKSKLPAGAKEGDVIVLNGDSYTVDANETSKRKKLAEKLMKELFKHSSK